MKNVGCIHLHLRQKKSKEFCPAVLISITSALSQTPVKTGRVGRWGQCITI